MINKCWQCLCAECSRFKCPYNNKSRCQLCSELDFSKTLDCDYFENKRLKPKRFKFKRIGNIGDTEIIQRLDYIIKILNANPVSIMKFGRYDVLYKGLVIFRGTHEDVKQFVIDNQRSFSVKLKIKAERVDL